MKLGFKDIFLRIKDHPEVLLLLQFFALASIFR